MVLQETWLKSELSVTTLHMEDRKQLEEEIVQQRKPHAHSFIMRMP